MKSDLCNIFLGLPIIVNSPPFSALPQSFSPSLCELLAPTCSVGTVQSIGFRISCTGQDFSMSRDATGILRFSKACNSTILYPKEGKDYSRRDESVMFDQHWWISFSEQKRIGEINQIHNFIPEHNTIATLGISEMTKISLQFLSGVSDWLDSCLDSVLAQGVGWPQLLNHEAAEECNHFTCRALILFRDMLTSNVQVQNILFWSHSRVATSPLRIPSEFWVLLLTHQTKE